MSLIFNESTEKYSLWLLLSHCDASFGHKREVENLPKLKLYSWRDWNIETVISNCQLPFQLNFVLFCVYFSFLSHGTEYWVGQFFW